MAVELGTAYISILPSTKGLGKSLAKEMGNVDAQAEATGRKAGGKLSSGLGKALKLGAATAGAAVAGLLGTSIVKGFQRLSAIENAEAKLAGLGNSAKDVTAIMENALASVKGTAFGMDEAATTAASAVAAGIKPGKELTKYLGLVGDAATIGGTSMAEMGSIFNKVATSGKVQGDVLAQLGDKGIPAVQMLAEEMGVAAEEVYELGSKGKISSDVFLKAMGSMEGAALSSGNTTTGAFKNMWAAVSRFGAGLLKDIFPLIGPLFGGITSWVDKATDAVGPLAEAFSTRLAGALKGVAGVGSAVAPVFEEIRASFTAFVNAWKYNDGEITSSGIPGVMEAIGYWARQAFEAVKTMGAAALPALSALGSVLSVTVVPAMSALLRWVTQNHKWLVPLVAIVGSGVLAFKAYLGVIKLVTLAKTLMVAKLAAAKVGMLAFNAVMIANPIGLVIAALVALGVGLVLAWKHSETFRRIVTGAWNGVKAAAGVVVKWFTGTFVPLFMGALNKVSNWFTGTIVPAFRRSTDALGKFFDFLYRNFIAPFVWLFRMAILGVTAWFRDTVLPIFRRATDAIGKAFKRLYDAYVKPVWDWIKAKIDAVSRWFTGTLVPAMRTGIERVMQKFTDFRNRVNTVWEAVKSLLRAGWDWVSSRVFDPFKRGLDGLKESFQSTQRGISGAWDKLREAVKKPVSFVVNKVINPFIGGYNKLNDFWSGTDLKKIEGFHAGGYTGPGSKYQPAGVVHADEFVIRKESQNDLRRNAPGLLDSLNKHGSRALGYATGGLVGKRDNPEHMAVGARVYGGAGSFTNALQHAIARTGELNVRSHGSLAGWGLGGAIKMLDRATNAVKVQRGGGHSSGNTVGVAAANYPDWWGGYYMGNSVMLNNRAAGNMPATHKRTLTAHELGHAMGLPHSDPSGLSSVMSYANMYKHNSVTPADVSALSAIYGGSGKAGGGGGGGDGIDVMAFITEKLGLDKLTKKVSDIKAQFSGNKFSEMPLGIYEKFKDGAIGHAKDKLLDFGVIGDTIKGGATLAKVTTWMTRALMKKGMFSPTHLATGIARAMKESSGNPSAVQGEIGDINNRTGNLARGLMQVVPTTFDAFKEPGHDDIFDPIDNILASINYTVKTWGTLQNGWADLSRGYSGGGLVAPGNKWDDPVGTVHKLPQGVSSIYNGTGGAEYFQRVDPGQSSGGGLSIHGDVYTVDETQFANKVFRKMDQRRSLAYVA